TNLNADAAFSRLDAYSGGVLVTPALRTLNGVFLDEDPTGTIGTSQVTSLVNGSVSYTGGVSFDFGNVTNLSYTTVSVTGAGQNVTFANATNIDGASFYVSGGAHLSLPRATSYNHAATNNSQDRHFQATGASSLLSLTGVTTVTNGTAYSSHIFVD